MSTWCNNLQRSMISDSRWKASILIKSSHANEINSINNSSTTISNSDIDVTSHVDIVQLLSTQNAILITLLKQISKEQNYPTNGLFKFENFEGIHKKDDLIKYIKSSAFETGTYLNVSNCHKKNNYSITFSCLHFGKPAQSTINNKTFIDGYIQAQNTIIQPSHDISSIKNKSRNSNYKRAHSHLTNIDDVSTSKSNRSNTFKCGCKFQFSIFYDSRSQSWFLKNRKKFNSDSITYHTNHIWIDPIHLPVPQGTINKHVSDSIMSLLESGININSIITHIKSIHNLNIEYQTIYNMRNVAISHLIDAISSNPGGSSVDKLISIFSASKNVSFVYTVHRYDSGFVTFRKNGNQSITEYIHGLNNNDRSEFDNRQIKHWRDSLALSETNQILVAFAWAHDEEIKSTMMYPEFLAADITFGVNRQRRDLFLVAGINGNNRVFTSFRCFIPSKQENAYTWICNQAMPHLLSTDVLKFNQCISTDQEKTLNDSILTSIHSNKDSFKYSKLRLDCYHFFTKVWYEKVMTIPSSDDEVSRNILFIIKKWIMTWFHKIESSEEYNISEEYLKRYIQKNSSKLGTYCSEQIYILLLKITSKKTLLLHQFFKDVTTFDFIGDSIVEAVNFTVKSGIMSVSNSMDISNSAFLQIKKAEYKASRELLIMSKKINAKKTWTSSKTSKYLTDYAEGLACSNFDKRTQYTNRYIGNKSWFVVSSHIFDEKYGTDTEKLFDKPLSFLRCRNVTISLDNYMTCTCMYEKRWLMPCVHMCSVINDSSHYTPDLFHLRWWKHYPYLFKNGCKDNNLMSSNNISQTLKYIRENHYNNDTMKYKGIPLHGSIFLQWVNSIDENQLIESGKDEKLLTMKALYKMQSLKIPLVNGTKDYMSYYDIELANHLNISTEVELDNLSVGNMINDQLETHCSGSQVLSQQSDFRKNMNYIPEIQEYSVGPQQTNIANSSDSSQINNNELEDTQNSSSRKKSSENIHINHNDKCDVSLDQLELSNDESSFKYSNDLIVTGIRSQEEESSDYDNDDIIIHGGNAKEHDLSSNESNDMILESIESSYDLNDLKDHESINSTKLESKEMNINSTVATKLNNKAMENTNMSVYERLLPSFNEIVSNVKSEDQIKKAIDAMEKLSFDLIREGMKDRHISINETTFLGEKNGSKRPEKRHRSHLERSFK